MSDNIFIRYKKNKLINQLVNKLDVNIGFGFDDDTKNGEDVLILLRSYDYAVLKKYYESSFNNQTYLEKIDFDLYCIKNYNKIISYDLLDSGFSYNKIKELLKNQL